MQWQRARTAAAALAALLLTLAACGAGSGPSKPKAAGTTVPAKPATVDPASVKANELGDVPVMMYHRLTPTPNGEFDRTPADFRAEIERLYASNYRPVLARDLVAGAMNVPAGTTPVVLTFDDGTVSQYRLGPDGNVAPDTAVGILLDFAKGHPDFRPVATMYVNGNPFEAGAGTSELQGLVRLGFELGAHTLTHQNLGKASSEEVQKQLVDGLRVITGVVPDAKVVTMALPFGVRPKDPALAHAGSAEGQNYSFDGVFMVGSEPSPSPFAARFDPRSIPRIRSSAWDGKAPNFSSTFWLDTLDKHPERRYISDGNPDRVSFPKAEEAKLNPAAADRAQPY
ncbi:MAG: polysaccharide deacetylase family protein [Acidimicrobiales bacterium]